MKAGFGFLLWTTHVTGDHLKHLDAIKAAGYDGVEVPMFEGDPEHYRWLGERIADAGLERVGIGVMAGGNPISADPAERRAGTAHLDWLADCATALGAGTLAGPFHQPLGVFSGTRPTEDELARLVEAHQAMADRNPGLQLSLEPLNRFECYVLNSAAQAAAHVARVDRPNFGYLYDTFHANIEERDPAGVIGEVIGAINYIHISENDRGTPGRGHIDFRAAIQAAKRAGYDGWFTIEAFGHAMPDLAAATRIWRVMYDSESEVIEAGARVIRDGWKD
ncbi:MAG: sugar phosphate isomerase/epimerase family protein [Amaricoccus sp.]